MVTVIEPIAMIKTKKDLKFYLQEDAKRNGIGSNYIIFLIRYICGSEQAHIYNWIRHYRKWEFHANNSSNIFHKVISKYQEIKTKKIGLKLGISAHINSIGYGLRIIHISGGGGCRLGVKSMGNYCGINSGVIIGVNGDEDARPVIGDFVAFGPGAKAFGNITIGNNSFIAANAVVTKSFSENSVIGGVPARLIKTK